MSTLSDAALCYVSRGWHVFPCKPRNKAPATYHGLNDATIDVNKIKGWWKAEPDFNIGLATGKTSGVFVVDVDSEDGESGIASLERQHGVLPPTVESITGRGRHLFFAWPGRPVHNSVCKITPGVDLRGDGGYVILPPSIHPSGAPYAWSVDSADTFAAAPQWLLTATLEPTGKGITPTPSAEWRELVKGVAEGIRDCSVTKLAGHLLSRHVDPFVTLALLQGWNATCCTPPLPEKDIIRIVNSIARKEGKKRHGFGLGR
jgi:hypothetical protein